MPRFAITAVTLFLLVAQAAADLIVTPVVVDPRLAATVALATNGTTLFTVSPVANTSSARVFSVPTGGGPLTQLYSYNGQSSIAPNGITVLGSNLYWIDAQSGGITDTQIYRAPANGSGPVSVIYNGVAVGQPIVDGAGIATDGTRLYTTDQVQGRVHSLNPDGTGITQLATRYGGFFDRHHPNSIDVFDGTVYIADIGRAGFADTPPRVQAVSVLGGPVATLFQGTLPTFQPNGIAVDADWIYLSIGDDIFRMPRTGGTPTLFVSDPRFGSLGNLVLAGDSLYAVDAGSTTIWRIQLNAAIMPEPTSVVVFGVGLLGLVGGVMRRRMAG